MRLPFVSRRQHDTEIAALRRRVLTTEELHDKVEDERRRLAKELAAAQAPAISPDPALQTEIAELRIRLARAQAEVVTLSSELGEARKTGRLIEGGTNRPRTADAELRQAREHAQLLDRRLAEMTAANQRCTCGRTQ
jgi:chromosome segregation ATPase